MCVCEREREREKKSDCNITVFIENVNLDEMKDDKERRRVEAMINNFGQTPTKLFNVSYL